MEIEHLLLESKYSISHNIFKINWYFTDLKFPRFWNKYSKWNNGWSSCYVVLLNISFIRLRLYNYIIHNPISLLFFSIIKPSLIITRIETPNTLIKLRPYWILKKSPNYYKASINYSSNFHKYVGIFTWYESRNIYQIPFCNKSVCILYILLITYVTEEVESLLCAQKKPERNHFLKQLTVLNMKFWPKFNKAYQLSWDLTELSNSHFKKNCERPVDFPLNRW